MCRVIIKFHACRLYGSTKNCVFVKRILLKQKSEKGNEKKLTHRCYSTGFYAGWPDPKETRARQIIKDKELRKILEKILRN